MLTILLSTNNERMNVYLYNQSTLWTGCINKIELIVECDSKMACLLTVMNEVIQDNFVVNTFMHIDDDDKCLPYQCYRRDIRRPKYSNLWIGLSLGVPISLKAMGKWTTHVSVCVFEIYTELLILGSGWKSVKSVSRQWSRWDMCI